VDAAHRQGEYRFRFDWGRDGAAALVGGADVAVVVDVLSFMTTLSVAADRGIAVLPYRWRDDTADAFARDHDAVLAVGRSQAFNGGISLSPVSGSAGRSSAAVAEWGAADRGWCRAAGMNSCLSWVFAPEISACRGSDGQLPVPEIT
jgi:hypothetical protein